MGWPAAGGEGHLVVPERIVAAGGVADHGVVRAEDGRDSDGDVSASAGGSVVGPVVDERAGDEGFIPGTDEGIVADLFGKVSESVLVGVSAGELSVAHSGVSDAVATEERDDVRSARRG